MVRVMRSTTLRLFLATALVAAAPEAFSQTPPAPQAAPVTPTTPQDQVKTSDQLKRESVQGPAA
jgi:hypothetical protein